MRRTFLIAVSLVITSLFDATPANAECRDNPNVFCGTYCGQAYCTWTVSTPPTSACFGGDPSTGCTQLESHCQCEAGSVSLF